MGALTKVVYNPALSRVQAFGADLLVRNGCTKVQNNIEIFSWFPFCPCPTPVLNLPCCDFLVPPMLYFSDVDGSVNPADFKFAAGAIIPLPFQPSRFLANILSVFVVYSSPPDYSFWGVTLDRPPPDVGQSVVLSGNGDYLEVVLGPQNLVSGNTFLIYLPGLKTLPTSGLKILRTPDMWMGKYASSVDFGIVTPPPKYQHGTLGVACAGFDPATQSSQWAIFGTKIYSDIDGSNPTLSAIFQLPRGINAAPNGIPNSAFNCNICYNPFRLTLGQGSFTAGHSTLTDFLPRNLGTAQFIMPDGRVATVPTKLNLKIPAKPSICRDDICLEFNLASMPGCNGGAIYTTSGGGFLASLTGSPTPPVWILVWGPATDYWGQAQSPMIAIGPGGQSGGPTYTAPLQTSAPIMLTMWDYYAFRLNSFTQYPLTVILDVGGC